VIGGVLLSVLPTGMASSQDFPQASAEDLGLRLPRAEAIAGEGRRVIVEDEVGQPVVGLVHVEVGDKFVAFLPSGRLITTAKDHAIATDRDFEPATKELLIERFRESAFRNFQTKTTRRYLYVYNCTQPFVDGTSRILETMYPGLVRWCKNNGLEPNDPRFPMVVLIFATEHEFQTYRPMPDGVVAYYNTVTNQVVMYEQRKLFEAAPEIALKQSVSTIAHEGVHQILHNIDVQDRLARWPVWFSEGLAEYFAPTDVKGRIRWKGVGHTNDLRLRELLIFFQRNNRESTRGQLLRQSVESRALNSLGYAMSWSAVDYFAKRRKRAFAAYLKDVSALKPLESDAPAELFTKHFGTDFVEAESDVWRHLSTLPYQDPIENQVHYVGMKFKGDNQKEAKVSESYLKIVRFINERGTRDYRVKAFPNRTLAKQFERRWLSGD
jgi:hypothetical protein